MVPSTIGRSPTSAAQRADAVQCRPGRPASDARRWRASSTTLGCGVQVAATRVAPLARRATWPGKIRRPSPGSRPVPQREAGRERVRGETGVRRLGGARLVGGTGGTGSERRSATPRRGRPARRPPARRSRRPRSPPSIGVSSGGGCSSRTAMVATADPRRRARRGLRRSSRRCRTGPGRGTGRGRSARCRRSPRSRWHVARANSSLDAPGGRRARSAPATRSEQGDVVAVLGRVGDVAERRRSRTRGPGARPARRRASAAMCPPTSPAAGRAARRRRPRCRTRAPGRSVPSRRRRQQLEPSADREAADADQPRRGDGARRRVAGPAPDPERRAPPAARPRRRADQLAGRGVVGLGREVVLEHQPARGRGRAASRPRSSAGRATAPGRGDR